MPLQRLSGFTPDIDPATPGAITACTNIIPSINGIKSSPSLSDKGISALAATCAGAALLRRVDNTSRLFAGTASNLYELNGTSWTDVTRTVGGAYGGSAEDRWRFAQFGNVSIAAIKSATLQSSSSGAFADISGAPKAAIVETVGSFVMLCNTNEGTFGDSPDRWWCSALGSATDWTPAIATQCATGRLTSAPGPITAGKRLGQYMVVYKRRGIYLGSYVGPDISGAIWSYQEVSADTGAVSHDAVVNLETRHVFMGEDDFYVFDGANITSIGSDIREWWRDRVNKTYIGLSQSLHDRDNGLIYFWYPTSGITLDEAVVYNYRNGKWGACTLTIEASVQYVETGITYDSLGTSYSTYDDLPTTISYDSQLWVSGAPVPAAFDGTHELQSLNGVSGSWSFTTGDYGDEERDTIVIRVEPRYITRPSGGLYVHSYRDTSSESLTSLDAIAESNNRHDVLWTARWHRGTLSGSGDMEISGINYTAAASGRR